MAADLAERASTMDPTAAAEEEELVRNTAANAYAGGADTVRICVVYMARF